MDYKELIDTAIESISSFFESEFQYDCKSELSKKVEEYEVIVKNDKYDYRAAVVNRDIKRITLNEFYNSDTELFFCNIVHELLHILSDKDDLSKKFVEEGVVQLLTYKILCGKVSEKTLLKLYEQDGYRVPVTVMDAVYLLNKESILSYISNKDGYNQLLLSVYNIPALASAILTKSERCGDLSVSENDEILKILEKCNYGYSDLCCNMTLIDMIKKVPMSEELLKKMPLVIQKETNNYQMREKEKKKIYQSFLDNGLDGLSNISYDFGSLKKYNDGDNVWDYIFDITDQINDSDTFKLFKQNINNQFLSVVLSVIFKDKDVDIAGELISLLGIRDASMVDFFEESPNFSVHNIELDENGISQFMGVFLKNELLTDAIVENELESSEQHLLSIITSTFDKYGIVDFYVLNELFNQYKKKINNYDEYMTKCDDVLKRFGLSSPNVLADPNSVWIQGEKITSENYLQYMPLFEKNKFYSTRDANYAIQCLAYFTMIQQEQDKDSILMITKDWINDDGYMNFLNKSLHENYKMFIEWDYSNICLINSGKGEFDKLIEVVSSVKEKSLQQDKPLKNKK